MSLKKLTIIYSISLVLCIVMVLLGYRQLVEIPKLKQAISLFQQRELSTLYLALQRERDFLATLNYDYAVWDASYQYIEKQDSEFIKENFIDDTFVSLKIDGAFYMDPKLNVVWQKGYDSSKKQAIDFDLLSLLSSNDLQNIYPIEEDRRGVAHNTGFIRTQHGAVMFSATQLRKSDTSGENVGILVFFKKIRPSLVASLVKFTQLKLELSQIETPEKYRAIPELKGQLQGDPFGFTRQRVLVDLNKQPLLLLNITHLTSEPPPLIDSKLFLILILIMIIPLGMHYFVTAYLVNPVNAGVNQMALMLKKKRLKPLVEDVKIKELRILTYGFNELIVTINRQKDELEKLSLNDSLTGVANRRAFDQALRKSWARSQRSNSAIAIILLDIDYFKNYNDTLGHLAGDKALKQVANALNSRLRRVDDLIARYGGEEFVAILTNTDKDRVTEMMEQLIACIRELKLPNPGSEVSQYLTISTGAAICDDFSLALVDNSANFLLQQADEALYLAKSQGRNTGVLFNS